MSDPRLWGWVGGNVRPNAWGDKGCGGVILFEFMMCKMQVWFPTLSSSFLVLLVWHCNHHDYFLKTCHTSLTHKGISCCLHHGMKLPEHQFQCFDEAINFLLCQDLLTALLPSCPGFPVTTVSVNLNISPCHTSCPHGDYGKYTCPQQPTLVIRGDLMVRLGEMVACCIPLV